MATLTDEEIVARVRAGETQLFELIMRRHNRRIYRAARAILRDDGEAEDVMQDAYVRAYAHLHEFEGRALFSTWLTRIAVHEALARVRRGRRFQPIDQQNQETTFMPTGPRFSPEQNATDAETRAVLERAIDALPDEFRIVFVLRAVEEMTGAETAECLGIPEETVKTRLFRARARLQETVLAALEPAAACTYEFHLSRCDRVVAVVLSRLGLGEGERQDVHPRAGRN
ncbi:MAG TPA: RNA polymerase sigma factor [Polyangiaceae bacterium]|nr:RNA polymerase sigma factor [Polyangiaceae bacterium]